MSAAVPALMPRAIIAMHAGMYAVLDECEGLHGCQLQPDHAELHESIKVDVQHWRAGGAEFGLSRNSAPLLWEERTADFEEREVWLPASATPTAPPMSLRSILCASM